MRVCKNCGQMMNDKTSKCPSCGYKIKKTHPLIIAGIVGIIFLVIMIGLISINEYPNKSDSNNTENMNDSLSNSENTTNENTTYKSDESLPAKNDTGYLFYLGDTASYQNGVEITFSSINYMQDKSDGINYDLAEIVFAIINKGTKTITIGDLDFSLYIDNMNQEIYYALNRFKHDVEVAPSRNGEIHVFVDLSGIENASTAELQYSDSIFVLKNLDYRIDYTKDLKEEAKKSKTQYSLSDFTGVWESDGMYMTIYTYSDNGQIDIELSDYSYVSDAYFKDGEILYNTRILYDYNHEETGETAHGTIFMTDDSLRWIDSDRKYTENFKRYDEN